MKKWTSFALTSCLILPAIARSSAWAQAPADAVAGDFTTIRKNQRLSPPDVLEEFSRPAASAYTYGEGDEISVEVWGHPELSGRQAIGPDGKIVLPVAGDIKLAGLTRDEGQKLVSLALARYYSDISVEIGVETYTSNRIFVLGRVAQPGALHFDTTPTLLETITRAGSLPVGGVGADKAALNRCVIFRGRDKVVWVDLNPLLHEGNMTYNLQLQRNDIVYIPDSDDLSVYVLGEVQHPGPVRLRPNMTFMDAYAQAGGATKDGTTSHIQLIRPSKDLTRHVSMRALLQPDPGLNAGLMDGDIIYVPKRGLARIGYVLQQVSPVSGLAIVGVEALQ